MEQGTHDVVLMIIIAVIILLQFYVFWGNYRKIQDYKKTIEKAKDFKIVEVSVPEDLIKEIEVDEILDDPEAFQQSAARHLVEQNEVEIESENSSDEIYSEEIDFPDEEFDFDYKPEYKTNEESQL